MRIRYKQPVIIERLVSITLSDLRVAGFFHQTDGYKSLPLIIRKNNGITVDTYDIHISLSTQEKDNSYLELNYTINGVPVNYTIQLVQVVNPLTNAFSWYFHCPKSNNKCRILYLNGNHFTARTAIINGYYFRDTLSKSNRTEFESLKRIRMLEKEITGRGKKYFKSHRNGEHTKKQLRVMNAKAELDLINKLYQDAEQV